MKVKVLLGLALMSVALVGCGQTNQTVVEETIQKVEIGDVAQDISLNLNKLPETLDPQFNTEGEGSLVIGHVYEGLMRQVGDELINGLAQSYTVSEDGLTYTFTLRPACWSDSVEITAQDFVYAWRRGADPLTGSSHLGDYEKAQIKNAGAIARGEMSTASLGVLALDSHTLEVTLEAPNEAFLDYMALESFMPLREDIVSKGEDWTTSAVWNGPFKIASCNEQGMLLTKNETYWNTENVNLQNLKMNIMGDIELAEGAYLKNELDILVSRVNCVDTNNIILTPKNSEEDTSLVAEEVKAQDIDTKEVNKQEENTQNVNTQDMLQEEQITSSEVEASEREEGKFIIHSWLSGWRTNLQGQLWLGNAYVEEHE